MLRSGPSRFAPLFCASLFARSLAPSKPHSGKLTSSLQVAVSLSPSLPLSLCSCFRFRFALASLSLCSRFAPAFASLSRLPASDQAVDLLVSASSRIAALSPPTYLLFVSEGSFTLLRGIFFLRWASRLDAFSVYPLRISLPSYAVGTTTVAPGMRPLRSSRTRSSSSHDSFAHDG